MQIVRLGLITLSSFCISACGLSGDRLRDTQENGVPSNVQPVSNGEPNSKQKENVPPKEKEKGDKKEDKNLSTKPHDVSDETGSANSANKPEPDDACAAKEWQTFCIGCGNTRETDSKVYFNLSLRDRGDTCFNWKAEGYYENDNAAFSYKKLTLVTENDDTAKELKNYLEVVITGEAKGTVNVKRSLVVIRQFNADTFWHVIQAKRNRNEILDIVLTRCHKCESKPATAQ
jgi:hypothetical protein